jgi:hypothetical protein
MNDNRLIGTVEDPNFSSQQPVLFPFGGPLHFADGSEGELSIVAETANEIFGTLDIRTSGGQELQSFSQSERGYVSVTHDVSNSHLWDRQVAEWAPDNRPIGQVRDYGDVFDR